MRVSGFKAERFPAEGGFREGKCYLGGGGAWP